MSKINKKAQPTIESFFKNSSHEKEEYNIHRYFYLIWENKFKPNKDAYWCNEKPKKVNFITKINCNYIKTGYFFYLCAYFPDYEEKTYNIGKEKIYKNVHYLKSHLQKCIRKQNDYLAIPTCNHLLKLDTVELLRRLPIIMLEDTELHESFSTLIWLMIVVSSKSEFKMKKYI